MKFLFFSFVVVVAFFGRFDPYANAFRIDTSYKFSEQQMSIGKLKTMYNYMTAMSVCLGACTCVCGFDVVLVGSRTARLHFNVGLRARQRVLFPQIGLRIVEGLLSLCLSLRQCCCEVYW